MRGIRAFCGITAVLAASAAAQLALAPNQGAGRVVVNAKIQPEVVERAKTKAVIPVFIVLEHQPQREILARAEAANALYRQVAESLYQQTAQRVLPSAEELRQAREAAEAVLLRTRRQAFQEIEQAIGPEQEALESRLRGFGATRIFRYLGINMLAAEVPATAIPALEADPVIAEVFPVEKQYAQLATSVPALGAPAFWAAGYTGQGESVGILDSGIRTNHPAFAGVPIVSQVFLANGSQDSCFVDNASSPEDQQGHGTHVAGIVASQGSSGWTNYIGVAKGIGTLYNLKVGYQSLTTSDCNPGGAESDPRDMLAALDWAAANTSLRIFNYSYGSPANADDDNFTQTIDQYIDNYHLIFAFAAGNFGPAGYTLATPGIAYNGISVGNWASRGVMNDTSSRGPTNGGRFKPDLAAPGTNIYSAAYNWDAHSGTSDDFVVHSGTSMAAPHIAGSAALLGSAGISDPLAVKALLINTADGSGSWGTDSGWGFANLNTALAQLNYSTGALAAGDIQVYRASLSGPFRSTATWNRHLTGYYPSFNDLNLYLCSASTGAQLASSTTTVQNVEQVSASYSGDALVAVAEVTSPLASVNAEPYAIAFSSPATPLSGLPQLSVACSLPDSVTSGAQFPMTCTATNSGTLTAFATAGTPALPSGFSGPAQVSFGDIPPKSATQNVFNLTAPTVAGTFTIRFDVATLCGLRTGTINATATVQLALPAPTLLSPANGATGVSLTPTLSWSPSAGATSYQVYLGTSPAPPLVTTTSGTSYTSGTLSQGVLYYWQVVATNTTGASASATWAFTTQGPKSGPQQWVAATVAGGADIRSPQGDGGPATSAPLSQPHGMAVDQEGSFYFGGYTQGTVRKVTPDGIIHTVAGGGYANPGDGGPALNARIPQVISVAVDGAGNLYIGDEYDQRIRKVTPDGIIHTAAGNGNQGYMGDGSLATSAELDNPGGVFADAAGNFYIPDGLYPLIREVGLDGIIHTIAGNTNHGYHGGYSGDGGPATSAWLSCAGGVVVDASGNLCFSDCGNNRIRKIAPNGIITTVVGTGTVGYLGDGGPATSAQINNPGGLALDTAGNLFIADVSNFRIRMVAPNGIITTVAGNGTRGYAGDGGPAVNAEFDYVDGIAVSPAGNLYFTDTYNDVIRALLLPDSACQYHLDQISIAVSAAGGTVPVSVTTGQSCLWTASGYPSWITSSAAGKGSAIVSLVVAPNPGPLRVATVSIAGYALVVTQADSFCTYTLGPAPGPFIPAGGTGTVNITTNGGCPWSATSPQTWVTFSGPTTGAGSGAVTYTVAPDSGAGRSATLTIAGMPFSISQLGAPTSGLRFVPVTPCRLADTRFGSAPFGGPTMSGGEARSFPIPQSGCGIPPTAQAYSLNVTVVPKGRLGYLSLFPSGQVQPIVSTLNSWDGIVVANSAIVPAGFDGAISVFVTELTDVILDVNGYFLDDSGESSYSFYSATPCRVVDTRGAEGPFGGPALAAGETRDYGIYLSSCHLPYGLAYALNVTAVPKRYLGFLTVWPMGDPQPNTSTLNSWTGKVVANAAIAPVGPTSQMSIYASDPTDLILDVNGAFGPPWGQGALNFYPVTPCRVADTRNTPGPFGGPEMGATTTRSFAIPASACLVPSTAAAYSVNVTVVPDGPLSYLTAWSTGSSQPFVSTLNSFDGTVVANAAIVPAGTNGAISIFVTDPTHVILDINGYFAL